MFEQDLKEWKVAERQFASLLISTWWANEIKIPEWKFSDYDIWAKRKDGKERTFEIKTNKIFNNTWNVAFEMTCNWEPSWVVESKADYIVYQLWGNFYYQNRGKLLWMLYTLPHEEKIWWDLNYRTKLFIINGKYMSDLFKKL